MVVNFQFYYVSIMGQIFVAKDFWGGFILLLIGCHGINREGEVLTSQKNKNE